MGKFETTKESALANVLYYAAALAIPNILFVIAYNRNRVGNLLIFEHVLVLAGVFAVAGLLLLLLLRWAAGSLEGALLIDGGFWLCFWFFERMLAVAARLIPGMYGALLMGLLALLLTVAVLCCRRFRPPFKAIRPAFNVLALCLAGLFIVNLIPAVRHETDVSRARAGMADVDEDARPYRIRRSFIVDPLLPRPNIYWLHADGMMSLETAEWFLGEDFDPLRSEFDRRGFVRFEDAEINAGFTYASLTALLSPDFYDSYFGALLARHEDELKKVKGPLIYDELAGDGLTFYEDIAPCYELFGALRAAGYEAAVYNMGAHVPAPGAAQGPVESFMGTDLPQLLSMTTPLKFSDGPAHIDVGPEDFAARAIGGAGAPRFVFFGIEETHMSNVWRYDPDLTAYDPTAIHAYRPAYESAVSTLLHVVDAILVSDPGAVIVIQSDHGFHVETTQEFLLERGYSGEQVLELMYSTFSAVHIPPQYGGLDEPLSPLNISRELVNRFVGGNYGVLP